MAYDLEDKTEKEEKEALWRTPEREKIMEIVLSNSYPVKCPLAKLKLIKNLDYNIKNLSGLNVKEQRDKLAEITSEIRFDSRKYNPQKYQEIITKNRNIVGQNGFLRR